MSRLSKEDRDALIRSGEAGFVVRSTAPRADAWANPPAGCRPKEMPPGSVGDVNSDAKGSGARFNAGKPPMELIPVRFIAEYYDCVGADHGALAALYSLGHWQERDEDGHLLSALMSLGDDGWEECARVFDYGRAKYAAWNWAKGMAWSIPLACAVRHLLAMVSGGGQLDPESGLPHRGHVFCNIVMLLQFERTFPEGDDRPAAGLLA